MLSSTKARPGPTSILLSGFILIFFLDMHYVDLDFILEEEMEPEPILESESLKTENSMKTENTVESKRYSII